MPCDNMADNGAKVRAALLAFAGALDPDLAEWLDVKLRVPATMVDSITPASDAEFLEALGDEIGFSDRAAVQREAFAQWVVEDVGPIGPDLAATGVEITHDVAGFERAKLRILNGAHSTLSYLGYLAGHEYVSEVMQSPDFVRLIHDLITLEAMPTLDMPGIDLGHYRDELLARFSNPALKHRTWQIAMDGSQKLPQRLLGTIRDRLAAGQPIDRLALGVAAWMRYVTGIDEQGAAIEVRDPLAGRLRAIADSAHREPIRLAVGLLTIGEIFGRDLPQNEVFREAVTGHLRSLFDHGSAATVAALVRSS